MSNYGLVFRDATNGWIMLGEYDENGNMGEFVEITDPKYDDLPETLFAVVDVQHTNGRLGLLDLHQFEMFRPDGSADYVANVISHVLGMPDDGEAMFKMIFEQITEELFSGTAH